MRETTLAVLAALVLVSCAGRAPQPVAVVQPQDRYMDCTAIQAEILANNKKIQGLGSEEGGKVAQNVAAGVAGLFIWPLWFAMDFQGAASKEEVALQSRQEYLATLVVQKGCARSAPPVPTTVGGQSEPPFDPMRAPASVQSATASLIATTALADTFDGQYVGVSRISGGRPRDLNGRAETSVGQAMGGAGCPFATGVPVPLTIRDGTITSSAWSGYIGNGTVAMKNRRGDKLTGILSGDTIRAEYWGTCIVSFTWRKVR